MTTYHCTLAKKYDPEKHDVLGWAVSEKLDGVRALWCPERKGFFSRADKPLHAPPSWLKEFNGVQVRLDGEFFMGRGQFQSCVSAVRKKAPTEVQFDGVEYLVFDSISEGDHIQRLANAQYALVSNEVTKARMLPHFTVEDMEGVTNLYSKVLQEGGEGLMFRNQEAGYEMKRTGNLLKWKGEIDGTALVTGQDEGEGKHKGRMGALICIDDETGVCFRIGTGFTDAERQEWWDGTLGRGSGLGTVKIRWRAMERTRDNIPRHPAFVCIDEGD